MHELSGPLDLPAAWRGAELFARPDWRHELSAEDVKELAAAAESARATGLPIEKTGVKDFPLPRLQALLAGVQRDLEEGTGACLIRGFARLSCGEDDYRRVFWGLAVHLGTPLTQSAAGEKIFSVRDEGYQIGQAQARGPNTRKRLSFHTDRCDVIGFLCLRQAPTGGENQLVSSVSVYNEMLKRRPDLVEALRRPFYYQRHNVDTGNSRPWCRQPVFSSCQGHFACCYLRVLIDRAYAAPELPDMTPLERAALDYLEEVAADPSLHVTFRLEPGDLLLVNNWVTLHRRNEFVDHEDRELRRHLLRIWLAAPNSRPLVDDFADNYGATAAGAVRGGMRASVWT